MAGRGISTFPNFSANGPETEYRSRTFLGCAAPPLTMPQRSQHARSEHWNLADIQEPHTASLANSNAKEGVCIRRCARVCVFACVYAAAVGDRACKNSIVSIKATRHHFGIQNRQLAVSMACRILSVRLFFLVGASRGCRVVVPTWCI